MTGQTFNDGFPMDPMGAIAAAYFLSESEKQEWVEWVQSANNEQKQELVEILHSMWIENEKQKSTQPAPEQPQPSNNSADYNNQAMSQPPQMPDQEISSEPPSVPSQDFNQFNQPPVSSYPPANNPNFNPTPQAPIPAVAPVPAATPQMDPFTSTKIQNNVINDNNYSFGGQNNQPQNPVSEQSFGEIPEPSNIVSNPEPITPQPAPAPQPVQVPIPEPMSQPAPENVFNQQSTAPEPIQSQPAPEPQPTSQPASSFQELEDNNVNDYEQEMQTNSVTENQDQIQTESDDENLEYNQELPKENLIEPPVIQKNEDQDGGELFSLEKDDTYQKSSSDGNQTSNSSDDDQDINEEEHDYEDGQKQALQPSQDFSMVEAYKSVTGSAIQSKYQEYREALQDPLTPQGKIIDIQNDLLALTMETVANIAGLIEFNSEILDLATRLDQSVVDINNRISFIEQRLYINAGSDLQEILSNLKYELNEVKDNLANFRVSYNRYLDQSSSPKRHLQDPASEELEVLKMKVEVLSSKIERAGDRVTNQAQNPAETRNFSDASQSRQSNNPNQTKASSSLDLRKLL